MSAARRGLLFLAVALLALLLGPLLPKWVLFMATVSLAKGLAALGLLLLMRTGLVSFGQGLYYAIGGYAAGLAADALHWGDAVPMVILGAVAAAAVAALIGLLLARYRTIFFAMLSLAFSMILYGLLVKSSALG
jgi:branched-chain amino acid transport system permease protein